VLDFHLARPNESELRDHPGVSTVLYCRAAGPSSEARRAKELLADLRNHVAFEGPRSFASSCRTALRASSIE